MARHTKYVVIFPNDPLTMIGPHDNGVFHNLEDIVDQFHHPARSAVIENNTVVITELSGYRIIGQIHRVKSFL